MLLDHPRGEVSHVEPPQRNPDRPMRRRGRPSKPSGTFVAAGAMLRDRRAVLGLRLEDIAERVNISIAYASEVERGKKGPSADVIVAWAEAIDVDPAPVLCAFRLVPEAAAERFFDADRMRAALAGGV